MTNCGRFWPPPLADFVERLPDGLDTWVGEAGQLISAGQARDWRGSGHSEGCAGVGPGRADEGLDRITQEALVESLLEVSDDGPCSGSPIAWCACST